MKATIKGLRYDTLKATLVAEFYPPYPDWTHVEEHLYVTSNGRWFVHRVGNAMYEKMLGDTGGKSSKIIPMSPEEALDWLEIHNFNDEIDKYFKDAIEEA